MQDLEEELKNPNHSKAEIAAIQRKYDLKMTVYIYTSLIAGAETPGKAGAEQLERQTEPAECFAACRAWVRSAAAGQRQCGHLPGTAGFVLK